MFLSRHRALQAALLILIGTAVAPAPRLPILKAAAPAVGAQAADDRVNVFIKFKSTPDAADETLVRGAGGRIRHRYHLVPAVAVNISRQAALALLANPRVASVEPDVKIFAVDVDAELDNTWGVKRIGAGSVQDSGVRGLGVKVAVIDTGIDCAHLELVGHCAAGWDFVNNDADPFDDNGHGTHVAGTIAAAKGGPPPASSGVVGVAPEAQLYALKVLDQNGSGDFDNVIAALQWAVDHGIQITNNSYGSTGDPGSLAKAAFDNAAAAGILHVAAAGNNGTCSGTGDNVLFPARWDSVIAVAATDQADTSPCFSSTGPTVELAAPGVSINSTMPGGGYQLLSGTSMASPHVAGVAALVLSTGVVTDTNHNGRVNDEVRNILDNTAHDLGTAGRDTWYGFGLVDAPAAVAGTAPPLPGVTVSVTTNKSSYTQGVDTSAQLTAVVKDETGAPIGGLSGGSVLAALDGAPPSLILTETTVPGTYTGALNISLAAVGSHTVVVTATDARGISSSGSASFTVTVPNTVRVKSITYSTYGGSNNKRNLVITVLIVNGAGAPVGGATVSVIAYRNGFFYGAANGRSGTDGKAIFEASNAPSGCYQTLVAAVLAGTRSWDAVTPPNQYCK